MARTVKITTEGIKSVLRKLKFTKKKFYNSLVEYIWNGFDAEATTIRIYYDYSGELLRNMKIVDDGYGIHHDELKDKFDPFFESERIIEGSADSHSSVFHGKNGVGRLTFFTFANFAKWTTIFEDKGKNWTYEINIAASKLEKYSGQDSKPRKTTKNPGTIIEFNGIDNKAHQHFDEKEFRIFLMKEFCWFLELNKEKGYKIYVNDELFDYSPIIGDKEEFEINFKKIGEKFKVKYIRWEEKTHNEYSKFYYQTLGRKELYKENTTLNNQGDQFYHSIFIASSFFKNFNFSIPEGSSQKSLTGPTKSHSAFQFLMGEIYQFLRRKRKPFLKQHSEQLIKSFEEEKIIKSGKESKFEKLHTQELKSVIRGIYETQPKIFYGLKTEQKKALVGFLNLLLDTDEREKIIEILEQIVQLDEKEREELRQLLKITKLSRIIKTINIIKDRFYVLNQIKQLLFRKEIRANEVDHLQKVVQVSTWLFGEKYTLIAAAEDDFEKALREHIYILEGKKEKVKIDHTDKRKQVDIFICRQEKRHNKVHNIIIELKHPQKKLGESHLSQVKKYMRTIIQTPRFNADNYTWEFILVGTSFDSTGYLEGELDNNKRKNEEGLVHHQDKYKVYVRKWSDLLIECDLRHKFLDEKLNLEKSKMTSEVNTAEEAVRNVIESYAADQRK